MSETSSHDSFYDSLSDMQEESKNADCFPELSAFLSQEEISKSLDLARRAIANSETEDFDSEKEISQIFNTSPVSFCENSSRKETKLGEPASSGRPLDKRPETQTEHTSSPGSKRKPATSPLLARPSYIRSLRKAEKRGAKIPNAGVKPKPACQGKSGPQSQLCDKAANFIEELTSIFKEASKPRSRSPNGESSSPDSGYLSPKNQPSALMSVSASQSPTEDQQEMEAEMKLPEARHCYQADQDEAVPGNSISHPQPQNALLFPSAPRFIQKLRSQEVAEGSRVYLECRVTGNPTPRVRWFCEGKELHNTPDIQIHCEGGDRHTLVIAEAFEDDTGRYTCLATNPSGSDTTSAEVFIEGASSTDSDSESLAFLSKPGAMPQAQKKTTSVSLTIGSSSPKTGVTTAVIQPLSVPVQQVHSPTSYLCRPDGTTSAYFPPVFTKELQNTAASEGQVVVLECRVRGAPPLRVKWFRQGSEIQDSPDFRILQKKPRSTAEPEEICTLVIAETFPEDAGIFMCSARNDYGSVTSTAQLVVTPANSENCSYDSMGDSNNDHFQHFPPPPPILETSPFELASKKSAEIQQVNSPELGLGMAALQMPFNSAERETNGVHPGHGVNGMINGKANGNKSLPTPAVLLSPTKEPPPLLAKPKLDPLKIQQLQNQIRLEQEASARHPATGAPRSAPPSPPFPPPPAFPELAACASPAAPEPMSALTSRATPTMQSTGSFNYARPKQFIAAQNLGPASSHGTPASSPSSSSLPSPMSPTPKHFGRSAAPPFTQPFGSEAEASWGSSSPSPPPPPPPVFSPTTAFSVPDVFPLPPPPPPLPSSAPASHCASPSARFGHSQTPAAFLSALLPSQPPPVAVNALGLPKGVTPAGFPKKANRTARIASDEEIQGTKDAVIQDLERKLRFKEDLLNNGQPRLTYEERMARRLLGADSATVFNIQEPEEETANQETESSHASVGSPLDGQKEYKVSSCEQRLISEIEYRLERSPVDESGDEVQYGDVPVENGVAPFFETKLKHYKIFEGMPVTFTCKVTGNPKPKIYWFKDGKQISPKNDHYSIQRDLDGTCSLHTTASTLDDDGNYTIMAANPQGRVSCTGRLMVQAVNQRGRSPRSPSGHPHVRRPRSRSRDSGDENEPIQERFFRPHFLQAPGDLTVQEGKLCRMDCKVSGLPTPDLTWQLDGKPIRPDSAHKMLVRENGVHSLIIEPVASRDAGIYTCIATNRAGQNSFSLELVVAAKEAHKPPVFIEKLQNTGVADGYPVRLECRVLGVPPPQIFWKKENESLTHSTDRVSMHQDNHGYICLLIQGATKEDAGWYTVSAKNEAGIVSCTARLDVYTQWHQQPQSTKPKKVRPSASRYAALSDQGLDIKAAFQPEANPSHLTLNSGLVESEDL
ncbi:palladin, cytoskeletal associated protein [Phyllostomus discolor]|uniref:Palladin n=2 Tax=Phyllostomus discolor TaxID=89673 RepID=A0A6J2M6Y2_9CHIR|nr:palladin isoform X4 [Phyllostomus discolor]KAF6096003.1 palladin, cytoskeletal associated protein [Phyllostomus discolor]